MKRPERIEVLAIGDELLDGRVADTNTLRLAKALAEIGLKVTQRTTIEDDIDVIVREAKSIIERGTQLCVVSGGLGPTTDDVTAEAFGALAEVDLVRDAEQVARIEKLLTDRGREISDNQRKQADRPKGAALIPNPVGTAPGFSLTVSGCTFVSVPGVPHEYDRLVGDAVIAPLQAQSTPLERRVLRCFGLIEADVDERLAPLHERWPMVRVGYRAHFPTIHVSLKAPAPDVAALEAARDFVREELGRNVYTESEEDLQETVLRLLRESNATLAVAESCTGGLIGDLLTDVPGSSDVFMLGVVSYSNEAKRSMLGVSHETLESQGAVSEACVREMARGVRDRAKTTYGLSVSGIAGPGGGTPDKPVGTVWLAGVGPGLEKTFKLSLPYDRRRNKVISAHAALDLIRRHLTRDPES